jgi:hypothetical protein
MTYFWDIACVVSLKYIEEVRTAFIRTMNYPHAKNHLEKIICCNAQNPPEVLLYIAKKILGKCPHIEQ